MQKKIFKKFSNFLTKIKNNTGGFKCETSKMIVLQYEEYERGTVVKNSRMGMKWFAKYDDMSIKKLIS